MQKIEIPHIGGVFDIGGVFGAHSLPKPKKKKTPRLKSANKAMATAKKRTEQGSAPLNTWGQAIPEGFGVLGLPGEGNVIDSFIVGKGKHAKEYDVIVPLCSECGSDMQLLSARRGRGTACLFWGCSRYLDEKNPCKGHRKPVDLRRARVRSQINPRKIKLRQYQMRTVDAIKEKFDTERVVLVQLATGSGKTSVANGYIDKYETESNVLWVAPARELLDQAELNARAFRKNDPNEDRRRYRVNLEDSMPDLFELPRVLDKDNSGRGVTVYATEQTMMSFLWRRRDHLRSLPPCPPETWCKGLRVPGAIPDLIVVDEAHWAGTSKTGLVLLRWAQYHNIRVLGLSATPLRNTSYKIMKGASLRDLAKLGVLTWPRIWRAVRSTSCSTEDGRRKLKGPLTTELMADMEEHRDKMPESMSDVDHAATVASLEEVVHEYKVNQKRWGKTIMKVTQVGYAVELTKRLLEQDCTAGMVTARTPPHLRRAVLKDFNDGVIDILVVIGIGCIGLDVPTLRTIFVTHFTGSFRTYLQLIGRGSRKAPGKTFFNIVEFHPRLRRMRQLLWKSSIAEHLLPEGNSSDTLKNFGPGLVSDDG